MIYQEEENGLLHTYSDTNKLIQLETNIEYCEAYDLMPCKYTYKESENAKQE